MSNYLAIATVTAALQNLLTDAIQNVVSGAGVTAGRPEDAENGQAGETSSAGVNIFLFQVSPNPHWRNADLPTRRADGTMVQRPQTAIDLHYLLTFNGNDAYLEPQRLLGSVVSTLNAQPLLTRTRIESTISDALADVDTNLHYIGDSDLSEQIEQVRFTPLPLNLEELSKLWSVFFQIPYSLSVAYQASVVLIENEDQTPERALPVRARGVYAIPFQHPDVDSVVSAADEDKPIFHNSSVLIRGSQLRGEVTRVRVGDQEVTPAPAKIRAQKIEIDLPSGLRAGVQGLQVVHQVQMGVPPEPHAGVESNVNPFVLRPEITVGSTSSNAITLNFDPLVEKWQRVLLMLNEFNPPSTRAPYAYQFKAPDENGITNPAVDETGSITFALSGVQAGSYLVRAQVDGADSVLEVDEELDELNIQYVYRTSGGNPLMPEKAQSLSWEEANQRYLMAALDRVRAALADYASRSGAESQSAGEISDDANNAGAIVSSGEISDAANSTDAIDIQADPEGVEINSLNKEADAPLPLVSGNLPPEVVTMRKNMAEEPRIETLCAAFGLTPFERHILLLCAGMELEFPIPKSAGRSPAGPPHLQPGPGRTARSALERTLPRPALAQVALTQPGPR